MADEEAVRAGASLGTWAWGKREEIADSLAKLYRWFGGKKKDPSTPAEPGEPTKSILIIGPGGVGKSTLGGFLSGKFDLIHNSPGEYEETLGTESIEFPSGTEDGTTTLIIPPGQEHRRAATWTELYAGIAKGEFRGIILISAYGYHSLGRISYKEHKLYSRGSKVFLETFQRDRLAEELKVFRELMPYIQANQQKMWFLSLVTKQDLWSDQAAAVLAHYESGDWATEVAKLSTGKSADRFRAEMSFASLVIANYITGKGELLRKNTAGYDHNQYIGSLRKLIELLDALRDWEG